MSKGLQQLEHLVKGLGAAILHLQDEQEKLANKLLEQGSLPESVYDDSTLRLWVTEKINQALSEYVPPLHEEVAVTANLNELSSDISYRLDVAKRQLFETIQLTSQEKSQQISETAKALAGSLESLKEEYKTSESAISGVIRLISEDLEKERGERAQGISKLAEEADRYADKEQVWEILNEVKSATERTEQRLLEAFKIQVNAIQDDFIGQINSITSSQQSSSSWVKQSLDELDAQQKKQYKDYQKGNAKVIEVFDKAHKELAQTQQATQRQLEQFNNELLDTKTKTHTKLLQVAGEQNTKIESLVQRIHKDYATKQEVQDLKKQLEHFVRQEVSKIPHPIKGDKGDRGDKGDKGDVGPKWEFKFSTKRKHLLMYKREDERDWNYHDLTPRVIQDTFIGGGGGGGNTTIVEGGGGSQVYIGNVAVATNSKVILGQAVTDENGDFEFEFDQVPISTVYDVKATAFIIDDVMLEEHEKMVDVYVTASGTTVTGSCFRIQNRRALIGTTGTLREKCGEGILVRIQITGT